MNDLFMLIVSIVPIVTITACAIGVLLVVKSFKQKLTIKMNFSKYKGIEITYRDK